MQQRINYVSFRVGPKLHAAIRERARKEERTISEWARTALERALEERDVPEWADKKDRP